MGNLRGGRMNVRDTRRLGKTSLQVTQLGFGGGPLGNLFQPLSEEQAHSTVAAALMAGVRYFDTAPGYGHGLSEHRLGAALRSTGRDEYVLSTKIGRLLTPSSTDHVEHEFFRPPLPFNAVYDYSYDGTMRSFEDSLQRIGTNRIDVLFIHDVDVWTHGSRQAAAERMDEVMNGGYRAMVRLREQGVIGAIGCGLNEWEASQRFIERGDFDCFLLASRYTLLEQEALASFLPLCESRSISVIVGGPFNSGILATGAVDGARYEYRKAPVEILERVRRIDSVCHRHGVALPAAALQFPLLHPAVVSVVPGARTAAEIDDSVAHLSASIPADFWAELKAECLIREDAPTK